MKPLSERQYGILRLRSLGWTFKQIGVQYMISHERARQLTSRPFVSSAKRPWSPSSPPSSPSIPEEEASGSRVSPTLKM